MEAKKVAKKKTSRKENPFGKFVFVLVIIAVVVVISYIGKYINNLYNEYVQNKNQVDIYDDIDIYK